MSSKDERRLEHDRILLALGSHKGHDGIPGAPKGVMCLRCEAERVLERCLSMLEAAERLNQTWVERYTKDTQHVFEEIRLRREAESALAEARELVEDLYLNRGPNPKAKARAWLAARPGEPDG